MSLLIVGQSHYQVCIPNGYETIIVFYYRRADGLLACEGNAQNGILREPFFGSVSCSFPLHSFNIICRHLMTEFLSYCYHLLNDRAMDTKYEPTRIYLSHLTQPMTTVILRRHFEQFGSIEEIFRAQHNQHNLTWASVTFREKYSCQDALNYPSHVILGRQIGVMPYQSKIK